MKPDWLSSGSSAVMISGWKLYDSGTGGCHDGLHADRVNENQGAESTLAFLLSLAEFYQLESSQAAFRRATEVATQARQQPVQ